LDSRRPDVNRRTRRARRDLAAFLIALVSPLTASAQSLSRFSLDSAVSIDHFAGRNTVNRPNIVVDITGVVRLGRGWLIYVRPWFRQPRAPEWDREIYQAALQYERPGPVAARVDIGYLASPIGSGMMDTRPGINPTIMPHLTYLQPMPAFDPGAPRVNAIAASYPLGGQLTLSTNRWDARAAVVQTAPTRQYIINSPSNPRTTPAAVLGGGITPKVGMRFGAAVAVGSYVAGEELSGTPTQGRALRMIALEGEYAFNYTRLNGELSRSGLETSAGSEAAYAWFLQGVQTLAPRWFVAGRQSGVSSPPLRTGTVPGSRGSFHATEATVGFRLSPELTLRSSFVARKAYTRTTWDQQAGVSLVWAQRWR